MNFETASDVQGIIADMKYADQDPSWNRYLVNRVANGDPPYTDEDAQENNIDVNVNFLSMNKMVHDAMNQMNRALTGGSKRFNCSTDAGQAWQKRSWETTVNKHFNNILKGVMTNARTAALSKADNTTIKQTTAAALLHGHGVEQFVDRFDPFPDTVAIADCLFPGGTFTTLKNLNHTAIYNQWRPATLYQMAHGDKNPGWNVEMVDELMAKIKPMNTQSSSMDWNMNPEKLGEFMKARNGIMASDLVPTINAWTLYFQKDESEDWNKRIVLADDSVVASSDREFLFNPGDRAYATTHQEIIHVRYANASVVSPFLHATARSMGWILYAICHLENRLGCKFSEDVFSQLMWFFRVSGSDDKERLQKVDLIHKGVIPDELKFVTAAERFTPPTQLIESAFEFYRGKMRDNSASFLQDSMNEGQKDPTATYTMAKQNASMALLSALLNDAYEDHRFRGIEQFRRFMIPNSPNQIVKTFQERCIRDGVPKEIMVAEAWDIQPERLIGNGNQTVATAKVQLEMAVIDRLDPDSQRILIHDYIAVTGDDPKRADLLVPLKKQEASDTVHDAQLAMGTLMAGLPVTMKQGVNHGEYCATLIQGMGTIVQEIEQLQKSMAELEQVVGLKNTLQAAAQHLQAFAQNKAAKEPAKKLNDALSQIAAKVKGYEQRLQEQQQAQDPNDAETKGKIAQGLILARAKAQIMQSSHQQRTQQKQTQWMLEEKRKAQTHALDMHRKLLDARVDVAAKDLETSAEIKREHSRFSAFSE